MMKPQQHAILTQALRLAPFEGWTETMLARASQAAGLDGFALTRAFPGGVVDCLTLHSRDADAAMAQAMAARDVASLKIHERVTEPILLRLRAALPHREAIRRGVALLALPHHASTGAALLHETVDTIWNIAQVKDAGMSWYSRRALLAGVYMSTLLFWLDDASQEQSATREFLGRRIGNVLAFGKLSRQWRERWQHWRQKKHPAFF